jgi:hypothetical protein
MADCSPPEIRLCRAVDSGPSRRRRSIENSRNAILSIFATILTTRYLPFLRPRRTNPSPQMWGEGLRRRVRNVAKVRVLLRPDQLPDLLFDLVRLWKAVDGLLGKDLLPVEVDLERPGFAGGDRDALDLIGVIVQQVLRQTGGSREVPSGGAVLDPHHRFLPIRGVGHLVSSVHSSSLRCRHRSRKNRSRVECRTEPSHRRPPPLRHGMRAGARG